MEKSNNVSEKLGRLKGSVILTTVVITTVMAQNTLLVFTYDRSYLGDFANINLFAL